MELNLISFGRITEIAGNSTLTVDGLQDTDDLKAYLEKTFPALKKTNYVVAINKQLITEKTTLSNGATIALLPPFSGG